MGWAIVIAVIVVFMGLTALKDKVMDAAKGSVNRRMYRRTHQEGLEFVESTFFFAVDAPGTDLIGLLAEKVEAVATPPIGGLMRTYLADRQPSEVTWKHGTKFATSFTAVARAVTAKMEDGSSAEGIVLAFPEASTAGGVIADVSAMRALKIDVERALQTVDSNATCVVS